MITGGSLTSISMSDCPLRSTTDRGDVERSVRVQSVDSKPCGEIASSAPLGYSSAAEGRSSGGEKLASLRTCPRRLGYIQKMARIGLSTEIARLRADALGGWEEMRRRAHMRALHMIV